MAATPLPQLAADVRDGLVPLLPDLQGLPEAQRRKRLAQALGLPSEALTPEALLARFALPSAAPPGDLWPVLVDLLRTAVLGATRAMPNWSLLIEDVLLAGPTQVQPLGTTLPPVIDLTFRLSDSLTLVPGLAVRDGISLVISLPTAVPDDSTLVFRADGLELALADHELLKLLTPDGLTLKGSLGARLDKTGLRLEGGGNGKGIALPLDRAPAGCARRRCTCPRATAGFSSPPPSAPRYSASRTRRSTGRASTSDRRPAGTRRRWCRRGGSGSPWPSARRRAAGSSASRTGSTAARSR
ncbi:hypothetical protein GCM10010272_14360 [Streptomyces lateritius]|nr:hypothetical protein GCM10010272_14360 [Streptomyces lateritius]